MVFGYGFGFWEINLWDYYLLISLKIKMLQCDIFLLEQIWLIEINVFGKDVVLKVILGFIVDLDIVVNKLKM